MEYIIYFVLTFIFCYIVSYFLLVRKRDRYDNKKVPVEVQYMVNKYKLNMKNIDYRKFLKSISLVGSIDMATSVIIVYNINNVFLQLLVGFIVLIPLILVSFKLLAKYYIKRGFGKYEWKFERNRK